MRDYSSVSLRIKSRIYNILLQLLILENVIKTYNAENHLPLQHSCGDAWLSARTCYILLVIKMNIEFVGYFYDAILSNIKRILTVILKDIT